MNKPDLQVLLNATEIYDGNILFDVEEHQFLSFPIRFSEPTILNSTNSHKADFIKQINLYEYHIQGTVIRVVVDSLEYRGLGRVIIIGVNDYRFVWTSNYDMSNIPEIGSKIEMKVNLELDGFYLEPARPRGSKYFESYPFSQTHEVFQQYKVKEIHVIASDQSFSEINHSQGKKITSTDLKSGNKSYHCFDNFILTLEYTGKNGIEEMNKVIATGATLYYRTWNMA